ncbi:tRNA (adenosine(37)-N6)-threonylcarbamoyltransferase complex transferase subunit TsaD [Fundicoccus sp. Sow4_H7]|uniref:tRNA (adenosine(37)-N6)-threonylcarbamoyltransferase complex transferase subunit TsaD n=1 Tax=Fundicoccus sp. Sow4_H7 TaxID=3438784 RepID=UPI003F8E8F11
MSMILAIESSCDETSVAVIEDGRKIHSNIVASQVKSHMRFGGVVPEVASRHHVEQITQVTQMAVEQAGLDSISQVDAIAMTYGPGLVGALLIGVTAAKTLSMVYQKPLIAVNHIAGHIYANQLVSEMTYPLLALVISGSHTDLVYIKEEGHFEVIGETQDDAIGEAYDKVGRLLGLPYPAGKYLDELAQKGEETYAVPRAMLHEDNLDFSFSGMKSAVMNLFHNAKQRGESIDPANLATSFQQAVIDIVTAKVVKALGQYPDVKQFVLAGGVAANSGIRKNLVDTIQAEFPDVEVVIPPLNLCGDNAAMIGAAAEYLYQKQDFASLMTNAKPGLML